MEPRSPQTWLWQSRTSLYSFLLGALLLPLLRLRPLPLPLLFLPYTALLGLGSLVLMTRPPHLFADRWGNAGRAFFLGQVLGLGLALLLPPSILAPQFGLYLCLLALFHWSEFYVTSWTNPRALALDLYMLGHSRQYQLAAAASWLEYFLEWLLLPAQYSGGTGRSYYYLVVLLGFCLCVTGEALRKGAMWTARGNFNHYVQWARRADHELVVHGVYAWCRHPSYLGWFLWSIGTQLVLMNPICTLVYTIVSWRFFAERIFIEEQTLLAFFGEAYKGYQSRVPTGLPFIRGYHLYVLPNSPQADTKTD